VTGGDGSAIVAAGSGGSPSRASPGTTLTRLFVGTYYEKPGDFGIGANTLAPGPGRALVPWARSEVPGAADGGQKFDNVYYEIQNEPWADHEVAAGVVNPSLLPEDVAPPGAFWKNRVDLASAASLAWQARIAAVITEEEGRLRARHLVAQNYANHRYPVRAPDPVVDVLNFHYAWPEAATLNAGLGRVVSCDETGFANPGDRVADPETDAVYRRQAWEFLMAGGGVFSMLDYSFAVGHEDGTLAGRAPGGGSPALRRQLRVLKDFLHSFDIPDLRPRPGLVVSAPGAFTRALGTKKKRGVYVRGDGRTTLSVDLPKGDWREEWIDTRTGAASKSGAFAHKGGRRDLASPPYEGDVALRLVLEDD
jgi:hypothetical protein